MKIENSSPFKPDGIKINRKIIYLIAFLFVNLLFACLIVWFPFYFFLISAVLIFLTIVFWKTEESLIFLVFYLPFQIALNVTESIDLASSRIFIIILFFAWFVKSLAKKNLRVPNSPTTWLIVAFLGLVTISAYLSIDQEKSAIRSLFFFSIIPVYFIVAVYVNSIGKIVNAVYVLLLSASIAGMAGIAQFLGQFILGIDPIMNFWAKNIAFLFYGQSFGKAIIANPSWLVNIGGQTFFRAISFFPDPHMFSFYLGLIAPIALCFTLFSGFFKFSTWQRFLLYISGLIVFLALGLTFSRAGYVGAFFGITSIIFLGWKFFNKKIQFTVIITVLVGGIVVFSSSNLIVARFFSSFNPQEGSNSERLLNWRQSIKIIEEYPVAGAGVGAYAEAVNPQAPERSSVTAHNTYFDIAAEIGIPAAVIWVVILILTIRTLVLTINTKENNLSREKIISLGLVGSFVWYSAQLFFDTAIYSPALLAMFMIYLAISVNLEGKLRDIRN